MNNLEGGMLCATGSPYSFSVLRLCLIIYYINMDSRKKNSGRFGPEHPEEVEY